METKGMIKKAVMAGLIGTIGWVSMASVVDAGNKATIQVSATILPRLEQTTVRQAASFQVSKEDVQKGFVDVPAGTVLQVKTNSRNGYYLTFEFHSETAKEVWIIDNNKTTVLSNGTSVIPQSAEGTEFKELSYRVFLNADAQPGTHSFPVMVYASLL